MLRGCFRYALALGSLAALGLWHFAPLLAESWVGDRAVLPALRICALFLPLRCLGSVLDAYCTSLGRIRELIFVEFLEQGCSMAVTVFFLARESGMDSGPDLFRCGPGKRRSLCGGILRAAAPSAHHSAPPGHRIPSPAALPADPADLAAAGPYGQSALRTQHRGKPHHPQAAGAFWRERVNAMADYGIVHGMVFPVLMRRPPSCSPSPRF